MSNERVQQQASQPAFGLSLAAALIGATLGTNGSTLGRWLTGLYGGLTDDPVPPLYAAQAAVVALAVGFLVVVALGAHVAARTGEGATPMVYGALGVIAGSVFRVVKEMPASGDLPGPDSLQPLYFVAVVALLFGLPLLRPAGADRGRSLASLYGRISFAAILGGVLTALVQVSRDMAPSDWFPPGPEGVLHPSHSSFFIVRPTATGMLISAWAIATFDPWLERDLWRRARRRRAWTGGFLALAMILCAVYALAFNYPEHRQWIGRSGLAWPVYLFVFLSLMLPPLFVAGYWILSAKAHDRRQRFVAAAALLAIGPLAAVGVLAFKAGMPAANAAFFALAHVLTGAVTVLAVVLTQRYARWFGAPS